MYAIAELELVAGNLALDFLNTIEDRRGPHPAEALCSPADLAAWGVHTGLLTVNAGLGRSARGEFAAALALREHLTTLLDALIAGRSPTAIDLRALAAAVAAAYAAGTLVPEKACRLGWRWDPSALSTVRHTVAIAASDLLTGPSAARIGQCAGPGCGWFFLDTTKRGNRRWCSMRDCGQAAKSTRRRKTQRADR